MRSENRRDPRLAPENGCLNRAFLVDQDFADVPVNWSRLFYNNSELIVNGR